MGVLSKRYGEIRFEEGYVEGRVQGKREADELRLGCCDDVYLKGYDRGAARVDAERDRLYADATAEAVEDARLKGFEEGYDEAKLVFDPEGGYEDVKEQAYDHGWRAGQSAGYHAGQEDGKRAAEQNFLNDHKTHRTRLGGHGC